MPEKTPPSIIAFTGFIGAGKTTAAEILVKEFGYERVRFAGPLKAMMRAFGLNSEQVDGDQKEVPSELLCGITPRTAMQTLGAEWGRGCIHPGLWVSAWRHAADGKPRVVVDDLRFPNEADAVRALGGKIWRIERPGVGASDHSSESQQIPFDRLLYNEGDAAHFRQLVIDTFLDVIGTLTGPMGRVLGADWQRVTSRPDLPGDTRVEVRFVGEPDSRVVTVADDIWWRESAAIPTEWRIAR